MADYWALSSSNWSNLSNWLTGVSLTAGALPGPFDDVYANGRTIVVDITTQVQSINSIRTANAIAGGVFILNNGVSLSANTINSGGVTNSVCVTFISAAPAFATLVGNLCADAPSIGQPHIFSHTGTGTATIIGNFLLGRSNGVNFGTAYLTNGGTGTLNLIGNFRGGITNGIAGIANNSNGVINIVGSLSGMPTWSNGCLNNSTGVINVTGSVLGAGDRFNGAWGIRNISTGVVNIFGNITGPGIANESLGIINATGNCSGRLGTGSSGPGLMNSSRGVINFVGTVSGGQTGECILNSGNGVVNITGNCLGSTFTTAVNNTGFSVVNITGSVFGGSGSSVVGVINTDGNVSITGGACGGLGSGAFGATNTGSGAVFVRTAIANSFGIGSTLEAAATPGLNNTSLFGLCYVEELSCGSRGAFPTSGPNIYITRKSNNQANYVGAVSAVITTPVANSFIVSPTAILLYSSLTGVGTLAPLVSNVRFNTVYDFNSQTGTCFIPDRRTVLVGVPVDNTIGTFFSQLGQAWNTRIINVSTSNSFGMRLKNIITLSSADTTWALNE